MLTDLLTDLWIMPIRFRNPQIRQLNATNSENEQEFFTLTTAIPRAVGASSINAFNGVFKQNNGNKDGLLHGLIR